MYFKVERKKNKELNRSNFAGFNNSSLSTKVSPKSFALDIVLTGLCICKHRIFWTLDHSRGHIFQDYCMFFVCGFYLLSNLYCIKFCLSHICCNWYGDITYVTSCKILESQALYKYYTCICTKIASLLCKQPI